jgi:hypothetical protein
MSQLCVDTAKTVVAPHGAATVFNGHDRAVLSVHQHSAKTVAQGAFQLAIAGGGVGIDVDGPFMAAAVRATVCDTAEAMIICRKIKLHRKLLSEVKVSEFHLVDAFEKGARTALAHEALLLRGSCFINRNL